MIIEHVIQRTIKIPARIANGDRPIGQIIEDTIINTMGDFKDSGNPNNESISSITVTLSEEDKLNLSRY